MRVEFSPEKLDQSMSAIEVRKSIDIDNKEFMKSVEIDIPEAIAEKYLADFISMHSIPNSNPKLDAITPKIVENIIRIAIISISGRISIASIHVAFWLQERLIRYLIGSITSPEHYYPFSIYYQNM